MQSLYCGVVDDDNDQFDFYDDQVKFFIFFVVIQ